MHSEIFQRSVFRLLVVLFTATALTSCQPDTPPKDPDVGKFECVERAARATPPPTVPELKPRDGETPEPGERGKPRLQPVCPDGQVPKAPEYGSRVPKGNPLLGPEPVRADFDPLTLEGRGEEIREKLRKYEEVYPPNPPDDDQTPLPPDPDAGCGGIEYYGACYYYASASFRRQADGGGMTFTVERPAYDGSGGSGHALDEIAVQGGDGDGNIIELGWNVSSSQYGDVAPHLFVFHWEDWNPTCYDGCGWQQWSATYFPGMDLTALVGDQVYGGYVIWEGNWWAWFDNQWLGYFPGAEWGGEYTRSALIQWFGEVASNNGIPPRTDMGDGQRPAIATAAQMATLCDVDAGDWVCWYRDQQGLSETEPAYYEIDRTGFGRTRYGGPGE